MGSVGGHDDLGATLQQCSFSRSCFILITAHSAQFDQHAHQAAAPGRGAFLAAGHALQKPSKTGETMFRPFFHLRNGTYRVMAIHIGAAVDEN